MARPFRSMKMTQVKLESSKISMYPAGAARSLGFARTDSGSDVMLTSVGLSSFIWKANVTNHESRHAKWGTRTKVESFSKAAESKPLPANVAAACLTIF